MISANANDVPGKYSRAVITAEAEEDARRAHPDGQSVVANEMDVFGTWVSLEHVRRSILERPRLEQRQELSWRALFFARTSWPIDINTQYVL